MDTCHNCWWGGAAGLVQGLTTITRGASSLTTAGFGNPIISATETAASFGVSILTILFPTIIGAIVIILLLFASRKFI